MPVAQDEEVRRFKREVEVTRQKRDIFKKALAIFSRPELSYSFIAEHASHYPVSTMCRVLEVSVSGYSD